jgi:hypothetical protein
VPLSPVVRPRVPNAWPLSLQPAAQSSVGPAQTPGSEALQRFYRPPLRVLQRPLASPPAQSFAPGAVTALPGLAETPPTFDQVRTHCRRAAVLQELLRRCADPPQGDSTVAHLRRQGLLQQEGQVYFIVQGFHGIVYVATRRTTRRRGADGNVRQVPLLGKIYSTFLFDSYRRPYTFGGDPSALGCKLLARKTGLTDLQEQLQQTTSALTQCEQERTAAQRLLRKDPASAQALAELAQVEQQLGEGRALHKKIAADSAQLQRVLESQVAQLYPDLVRVRDAYALALRRTAPQRFPTLDLFLRELIGHLHQALGGPQGASPEMVCNVINLALPDLLHANVADKLDGRELWPLYEQESWRTRSDYWLPLMLENKLHTGHTRTYCFDALLPQDHNEALAINNTFPPSLRNLLRYAPQPVSHESVRQALHGFEVAKWYFDERLQRTTGTGLGQPQAQMRPAYSAALLQQHTQARKAAGLALIDQSLPQASPASVLMLKQRRIALQQATDLPLFAAVPWQVGAAEAAQISANFCFFENLPWYKGGKKGNCNSIAFAVLKAAAAFEQAATGQPQPQKLVGRSWLRVLGGRHTVSLLQPDPAPAAQQRHLGSGHG